MTRLAHKLRKRAEVQTPIQTPNETTGGFDRSYTTIATIWVGLTPIKAGWYRRGVQTRETDTHEVLMRCVAVNRIGGGFAKGFSSGFAVGGDLTNLKTNYFLFVRDGSNIKGRRFKINNIENADDDNEYYKLYVEELEEVGTGYDNN